ncbi:MBL fold metallo-hydrolase [Actinocorallia sp. B10E7]|uniref:MBL fold metallo-hydrolase n=1 Tax=Actinocorallia sp. B10E7 TaxID=3153558 RepID=UPI00325EDE8E
MSNRTSLAVTRVANSCVLLEFGEHTVLTDPFFTERWHLHRGEPLGMTVAELPRLTALVASHAYPNHWDLRALREYPHKSATPVYVSTTRMARQARSLGFTRVRHLEWGRSDRPALELAVRAVPAGGRSWWRRNAYLLDGEGVRVFFGGEIGDVAFLERHREAHPAVDVALLPVNGLRAPLGPPVVMGPEQAVRGAGVLGARVLIPIHDAHDDKDLPARLVRRHGSGEEAAAISASTPGAPETVLLPTGRRWTYREAVR